MILSKMDPCQGPGSKCKFLRQQARTCGKAPKNSEYEMLGDHKGFYTQRLPIAPSAQETWRVAHFPPEWTNV